MGSVQKGGNAHAAFDRRAGPGFRRAALRTALPQHRRRDQRRDAAGRRPDARQAQPGRRAVGLGQHGGRGLPDAGCRGVSGQPAPQRLLCTGIPGPPGPRQRGGGAAGPVRRPAARRPAGPVRPFDQRGGHKALPGADLGAAAEGAALHLARAAFPRRPAGGARAAAGAGRLSGRIPRGPLRAGTDRGSW